MYGINGIMLLFMSMHILIALLKKHVLKHSKINWF